MFSGIIWLICITVVCWGYFRYIVQRSPPQLRNSWVVGRKKNGEDIKLPSNLILQIARHVPPDRCHLLRRVYHAYWSVLPVPNETSRESLRRVLRAQITCEFPLKSSELSKLENLARC